MYIFMDETASTDNNLRGYGSLFVKDSVFMDEVITEALENLEQDPDRHDPATKDMDDRTLDHQYFHASEDSKNAHSHFCRAICKSMKIHKFQFSAYFTDKQELLPNEVEDMRFNAYVSAFDVTNAQEPVTMVFEAGGPFSMVDFQAQYQIHNDYGLMANYDTPFIPHCCPDKIIRTGEKQEPGLQIADFMLWTQLRKLQGDDAWDSRLPGNVTSHTYTDGWHWYERKNGDVTNKCYYDVEDYNLTFTENISTDEYIAYLLNAEGEILSREYPAYMSQTGQKIEEYRQSYVNMGYSEKRLDDLARLYLMIFDTLPIITADTDKRKKAELLAYKKLTALLLRTDLLHGTQFVSYFLQHLPPAH